MRRRYNSGRSPPNLISLSFFKFLPYLNVSLTRTSSPGLECSFQLFFVHGPDTWSLLFITFTFLSFGLWFFLINWGNWPLSENLFTLILCRGYLRSRNYGFHNWRRRKIRFLFNLSRNLTNFILLETATAACVSNVGLNLFYSLRLLRRLFFPLLKFGEKAWHKIILLRCFYGWNFLLCILLRITNHLIDYADLSWCCFIRCQFISALFYFSCSPLICLN